MISVVLPKYIAYLLPISFFLAILIVCGRMFSNSELVVMFACGISWFKFLRFFMIPALFLFIIELILTLIIVPQINHHYSLVKNTAIKNSLISFIQPKKIIYLNSGKQVMYINSIDNNNILSNIFIYQKKSQGNIIITAPKGYIEIDSDENQFLILENGYIYDTNTHNTEIQKGNFEQLKQFIPTKVTINHNLSTESMPTMQLIKSTKPIHQSELQWRLSLPLAIPVLTFIALTICKTQPRSQNRYSKIIPGILIFIVYFNLLTLAKSWTSDGTITPWLGLWWVHALFIGIMSFFLKKDNGRTLK